MNRERVMFAMLLLALPGPADADRVTLRDGTELSGQIKVVTIALRSSLGDFTVPPEKLLGLRVSPGAGVVELLLVDGQRLRGKWTAEPLQINLPGGQAVTLPLERIASVTFVESPATAPNPEAVPHVLLRDGQRLSLAPGPPLPAEFRTRYGMLALPPETISRYAFTGEDEAETLHRLVLRNGTSLSGLLTANELKLPLQLGPTVTLPRGELARLVLHPADRKPEPGQWTVTLRNGDRLVGTIQTDRLTLLGELGEVTLPLANLRQVAPLKDGRFEITQARGPTLRGVLVGEPVIVELPGGQSLRIPPADITGMKPHRRKPAPASAPAEAPRDASAAPDEERKLLEEIDTTRKAIRELREKDAALAGALVKLKAKAPDLAEDVVQRQQFTLQRKREANEQSILQQEKRLHSLQEQLRHLRDDKAMEERQRKLRENKNKPHPRAMPDFLVPKDVTTLQQVAEKVYRDGNLQFLLRRANPDVDPENLKPGLLLKVPPHPRAGR